jgi:hypothetical protein
MYETRTYPNVANVEDARQVEGVPFDRLRVRLCA